MILSNYQPFNFPFFILISNYYFDHLKEILNILLLLAFKVRRPVFQHEFLIYGHFLEQLILYSIFSRRLLVEGFIYFFLKPFYPYYLLVFILFIQI